MTQHTTGPWTASGPSDLNGRYSVYAWGPLLYCDRAEDARLIAAAPDLLACLLDVLDADGDLDSMDWNRYRAAILKATGAA